MSGKPDISAGAVLLLAALVFFCGWAELAALIMAAAVHECGHLLALRALGGNATALKLDGLGARIELRGGLSPAGEVLAAAAGPAAGFAAAVALKALGTGLDSDFLCRASQISAALSIFNLLPVPQLDGGRILAALCGEVLCSAFGAASCCAILAGGLALIYLGAGAWLFIAGLWLTLMQADL